MNTNMSQLMTVDEAADFLRLKPSTIRSWHTKGKLPRVKLGSRVFVHRRVCEALIDGKVQSTAESHELQSKPQRLLDADASSDITTTGKGNLIPIDQFSAIAFDSEPDSAELVSVDKDLIMEPKYLQQIETLAAEWQITTREVAYRLLKSALDRILLRDG